METNVYKIKYNDFGEIYVKSSSYEKAIEKFHLSSNENGASLAEAKIKEISIFSAFII